MNTCNTEHMTQNEDKQNTTLKAHRGATQTSPKT